jgi:hypothetical protein
MAVPTPRTALATMPTYSRKWGELITVLCLSTGLTPYRRESAAVANFRRPSLFFGEAGLGSAGDEVAWTTKIDIARRNFRRACRWGNEGQEMNRFGQGFTEPTWANQPTIDLSRLARTVDIRLQSSLDSPGDKMVGVPARWTD